MAPRDGALAHSIADAAVRRWLTLEMLIGGFMERPPSSLDPQVRAGLLCGAAQLAFLDRVPSHAAIDLVVEWVGRGEKAKASGLVNAVLRKVAGLVRAGDAGRARERWTLQADELPDARGGAIALSRAVLPADVAALISLATSTPLGLVGAWVERWGVEKATAIAHHGTLSPPVVVNVAHVKPGTLPPGLAPHDDSGSAIFEGSRADLMALLGARPELWVQDSTSSATVASVGDLRPRLAVDLCAGFGTKTRQLAAVFPDAEIIASDPDQARSAALVESVRGLANVRVVSSERTPAEVAGRADLVLCDVPCSNSGVLARRVEARYRCGPEQTGRLVQIQRGILKDAAEMLSPKGSVLYATCSIDRTENEEVAEWAASALSLKASRERMTLPTGLPGEAARGYRDGGYSVLLGRG